MKIELDSELPFLTGVQLVETAATLDSIHKRTLKAIDRLQADVASRKQAIAARWKTANIGAADKQRIEAEEVRVSIMQIKENSQKELDGLLKEAGNAHSLAMTQRHFYDSPVKTLNRMTLGDPKRSEYLRQVETMGPMEVAHVGQWAVSTKNVPLAAALVAKLDTMSLSARPFGSAALADAMKLDEHRKGSEALRVAAVRFQGVLVAIRAWNAGASNPLHTLSMGLANRALDDRILEDLGNAPAP